MHPLASAIASLPVEVCAQAERLQWHLPAALRCWACTRRGRADAVRWGSRWLHMGQCCCAPDSMPGCTIPKASCTTLTSTVC